MKEKLFKQYPVYNIKASAKGRTRKGIAAVFGNVDSGGDRIQPGAFAKTILEQSGRVKHLWNHDMWTPPIAKITELKEVGRDQLPAEVIAKAPEATGGLMVEREYFEGVAMSDWVLAAIDADQVNEMSFGYRVIKSAESTEDEQTINDLLELRLFDTSDVNWGMNSATVATGAKSGIHSVPVGLLVQQLTERMESGAIKTDAEIELMRLLITDAETMFAAKTEDLAEPPPAETETKEDDPDNAQAEAAFSTSLLASQIKLQNLKLETLKGI